MSARPLGGGDGMNQARFQKQQREKARREKAAAKFAKKVERKEAAEAAPDAAAEPINEAAVLAELAELHQRFEAEAISFEDFSAAKEALIERLDSR